MPQQRCSRKSSSSLENFQNDGKVEVYESELVAQRLRSRLATRVPRHAKDIEDMGRQELVDCIPGAAAAFAATDKLQREDQQAQETSEHPDAALLTAYHDYIGVRACQKARAGYEQIYVSDDEVEAAKDIVKAIEDTIRQRSPSIDKDKIWEDADGLELGELVDKSQIAWMNKNAQQYVLGMRSFGASAVQNGQFNEYGRAFCSSLLQSLRATAKGLNIAMTHKKDF